MIIIVSFIASDGYNFQKSIIDILLLHCSSFSSPTNKHDFNKVQKLIKNGE